CACFPCVLTPSVSLSIRCPYPTLFRSAPWTGLTREHWEAVADQLLLALRPHATAQLRLLTPQLVTTIEEHVGSHVVSELKVTGPDRKSTRLNSSHVSISYAVF